MSLIKSRPPRFYQDINGVVEACYSMPKKSGNGTKEPTIADARELGLLPSVTTILGVLAKPGLERWKIEQAIHSALTLPKSKEEFTDWKARILSAQPKAYDHDALLGVAYHFPPGTHESEDAFARRVVQDMDAQAVKAAEFGTRIHDAIAEMMTALMHWKASLKEFQIGLHPDIAPYLQSFIPWALDNIEEVHAVEKVVGGKHCGYAGRLDLDCTLRGVGRVICDFKSQAVKEGKEPVYYKDWAGQLAAYSYASEESGGNNGIMSIVIDSRTPGPVHTKLWTFAELVVGESMFEHCFELWRLMNDYYPGE